MKKFLFTILLMVSPFSNSQEAIGTIEEFQVCATGEPKSGWYRTLQFKVDGKWFGTWADYRGGANDYENDLTTSLVFMAFSQNLQIHIKARDSWHPYFSKCGVTSGTTFEANSGDFIRIRR